jgi:metal-responsive CopG/Arc/MetJ family transcriptional regulator
MVRTNIYLEDDQTAKLDRMAADEGISRAELIRRFLDRALSGRSDDLEADLAAIEDSFGVLEDVEPTVRDAGDREEHLARMWRIGS